MKFLKLLDPHATREGTGLSVGAQQEQASQLFPVLVEHSYMHYWRPGDAVTRNGLRLLIGLAATFDLKDLRLADIVNDALSQKQSIWVDVFNLACDCSDSDDLKKYFPIEPPDYVASPIVGVWTDGKFKFVETGSKARCRILESVGSSISAGESVANLRPPARALLEG